ncbi:MAG: hypothetical protein HQK83_07645 [Fibrobacteria bacterium]|nr:hypothetical protein [Fibrobacteria bacterium]
MGPKQLTKAFFTLALCVFFKTAVYSADLNLYVKTLNPTSIQTVDYYTEGVFVTTPGNEATTPVLLSKSGVNTGTHYLTTAFGNFYYNIDETGNITFSAGQPITMEGNTATINNTVNFTLTLNGNKPTSINQVYFFLYTTNARSQLIEAIYDLPGSELPNGRTVEMSGMVENQRFLLTSVFGNTYFKLDNIGELVVTSGISATADNASHTITIQNNIDFDLTINSSKPSSMEQVYFFLYATNARSQLIEAIYDLSGSDLPNGITIEMSGMVENQKFLLTSAFGNTYFKLDNIGELVVTSGISATTDNASRTITIQNNIDFDLTINSSKPSSMEQVYFFLYATNARSNLIEAIYDLSGSDLPNGITVEMSGMVENQRFLLTSAFGNTYFKLDNNGELVVTSGISATTDNASRTITIQNNIDFDLTINGSNPTSMNQVYFFLYATNARSNLIEAIYDLPGSDLPNGQSFQMYGMVENQRFLLTSAFGNTYFKLDNNGELVTTSGILTIADNGSRTLTIQNNIDFNLVVYALNSSSINQVYFQLYANNARSQLIGETKYIAGDQIQTPFKIQCFGMAANQMFLQSSTFGNIYFKLLADGTVKFSSPVVQVTSAKGSLSIESGTNTLFCEALPPNNPPNADAGNNFEILSQDQNTAIIEGTASDPDEDELTYRWMYEDSVLIESEVVNGLCELDLNDAPPLSQGSHSFTLVVTDGKLTVEDVITVTVGNSSPIAVASGGGVYQLGIDEIVLTGEVSDYDGDQIDFQWVLDGNILSSGIATPLYGGSTEVLPEFFISSSDIGLGTHTIQLITTDAANNEVVSEITVEVKDSESPTLAPLASTQILWPPNHKMQEVVIEANAADNSGQPVVLTVEIASSETLEFEKDGTPIPDFEIIDIEQSTGTIILNLRSERKGKGDGRIYSVTITATDNSGNSSTTVVEIKAPHNQ